MKKLLTILCLVLLVSCSNEVPSHRLIESGGLIFEIDSNKPFTGVSTKYEDGRLTETTNYKNGIVVSKTITSYNYRGEIDGIKNYKNGNKDGLWETYHENGQLKDRINYKDGNLDGFGESFHENGQISFSGNYENGNRNGWSETYYENGQLMSSGNYKSGKEEGLQEYFHENGQISMRTTHKDGGFILELFEENGQLSSRMNYKDGKQDGLQEIGSLTLCYKEGESTDMSYCED